MFFPYTFAVVLFALAASVLRGRVRGDVRNGIVLGLGVWGIALLLTAAPVLKSIVPYSVSVDRYVAGCLAAATLGFTLVRKRSLAPPSPQPALAADRRITTWLGWVGAVGHVLLLIYALTLGVHLGLSYLLHNLGAIRANGLSFADVGIHGPFGLLGSTLAPASYLYLVMSTRAGVNRALFMLNGALIVLVAMFLYAGRQTIVVACLLVAVGLWLRGWRPRVNLRTAGVVVIALVSLWYFTGSFVSARAAEQDPRSLLRLVSHSDYGRWTARRAEADPRLGDSLVQYSYFSSPLINLSYYLETRQAPGPLFGAYSFPTPMIFARLAVGGFASDQWSQTRQQVFRPYTDAGYLGNVWSTILRDLYVDFGEIGAIIFCAVMGGFIAWARNRFEDTGEAVFHALETYGTLTLGFGAFQSLLYPDYMSNAFFVALAIVFVRHLLAPSGSRHPRTRSARRPSERAAPVASAAP